MSQDNHCSLDDLRFKRFTHALRYQQKEKKKESFRHHIEDEVTQLGSTESD